MASLEEQFEAACAAGDISGVVLVARDIEGKFTYQKAFGPKSPTEEMDVNATFILASCTKIMTSIAALQCVERGQVGLDDDLGEVLSELKDCEIITGFKEGTDEPILKKAENKITLRQLLTHTSGFGNERENPLLNRWRKSRREGDGESKKGMSLMQLATKPLIFEPGTSWSYGASTDWVGILVMRLNNMSLEAYMQKYIWDPLGIENMTFHLELKPEVKKNLVTLAKRGDQGLYAMTTEPDAKVKWIYDKLYDDPVADEFGSGGALGSAVEFIKILESICADEGRLLMSETIDEMCSLQLSEECQEGFAKFASHVLVREQSDNQQPGLKLGLGLVGSITLEDSPIGFKTGTLGWTGLPNLIWTIDMETGLSLMYASNMLPFGDIKSYQMQMLFAKEMYKRYAEM